MESSCIGQLKGVGKVNQLTTVDVFTRWTVVTIVLVAVQVGCSMRFVDHVLRDCRIVVEL